MTHSKFWVSVWSDDTQYVRVHLKHTETFTLWSFQTLMSHEDCWVLCHIYCGVKFLKEWNYELRSLYSGLFGVNGSHHSFFEPSNMCAVCLFGNLLTLNLQIWLVFYMPWASSVVVSSCINLCFPHVSVVHLLHYVSLLTSRWHTTPLWGELTVQSRRHCSAALVLTYQQTEPAGCHVPVLCFNVTQGYSTGAEWAIMLLWNLNPLCSSPFPQSQASSHICRSWLPSSG